MSDLLPCPFCGGEGYIQGSEREGFFASCRDCYVCIGEAYDRSAMPEHMFRSEEAATDAWNRRRDSPKAQMRGSDPTHRHKKRGSAYTLIGFGKMQSENWCDMSERFPEPTDMREVAIYRSVDDGSLWVRPREEFEDGRFEALSAMERSNHE